jgi:hypothetical protein
MRDSKANESQAELRIVGFEVVESVKDTKNNQLWMLRLKPSEKFSATAFRLACKKNVGWEADKKRMQMLLGEKECLPTNDAPNGGR